MRKTWLHRHYDTKLSEIDCFLLFQLQPNATLSSQALGITRKGNFSTSIACIRFISPVRWAFLKKQNSRRRLTTDDRLTITAQVHKPSSAATAQCQITATSILTTSIHKRGNSDAIGRLSRAFNWKNSRRPSQELIIPMSSLGKRRSQFN